MACIKKRRGKWVVDYRDDTGPGAGNKAEQKGRQDRAR